MCYILAREKVDLKAESGFKREDGIFIVRLFSMYLAEVIC